MEQENELILHMLTITFSKWLCENGPGTLRHMLNSRLSASRIKMGRSEIHPHSSTHLSCLWMHSGFVCLAPISPVPHAPHQMMTRVMVTFGLARAW